MSENRTKASRRRYNDELAIAKQVNIAKQRQTRESMWSGKPEEVEQNHRFAKRHAMDCGNPGCYLCGNPRHTHQELTAQEKRLFQDIDSLPRKKLNGNAPPSESDL